MSTNWYHDALGVSGDASKEDILEAYRKRAIKYHPDHNKSPFAKERMQELNQAREEALNYLSAGSKSSKRKNDRPKRANNRPKHDGRDLGKSVSISLNEAYIGCEKFIDIKRSKVKVAIPPGAATGTKIRVSGAGEEGSNGGLNGDLIVTVQVKIHSEFNRDGDDLIQEIKLDDDILRYGGEYKIYAFTGVVDLKIPVGIRSGHKLRLRGKGMPKSYGGFGDMYVIVKLEPDSRTQWSKQQATSWQYSYETSRQDSYEAEPSESSKGGVSSCSVLMLLIVLGCIAVAINATQYHNAAVSSDATGTSIALVKARATSTALANAQSTATYRAEARATSTALADAQTTATYRAEARATANERVRTLRN